ncbi:MAG: DUF2283 domain-containing protein [Deltaproteobacteria bacterium]|nr:DUF2283 domain-containing protein [Deltaproteobacteria bacterium]
MKRTVEIEEGLNIDIDEYGKLIGLDVLDATDRYFFSRHFQYFYISREEFQLVDNKIRISFSYDMQ